MLCGGVFPHRQVTDDTTTSVLYKTINAELQCPVCMSIIRNACIVLEVGAVVLERARGVPR